MARSALLRLTDMREAMEGAMQLTSGSDYKRCDGDWAMQRAVERALEIISEAGRHLPDQYKQLGPEIPWRQIAAIGNLLPHEYQRADSLLIWNIVIEHLQRLAGAVNRLLAEAERR